MFVSFRFVVVVVCWLSRLSCRRRRTNERTNEKLLTKLTDDERTFCLAAHAHARLPLLAGGRARSCVSLARVVASTDDDDGLVRSQPLFFIFYLFFVFVLTVVQRVRGDGKRASGRSRPTSLFPPFLKMDDDAQNVIVMTMFEFRFQVLFFFFFFFKFGRTKKQKRERRTPLPLSAACLPAGRRFVFLR